MAETPPDEDSLEGWLKGLKPGANDDAFESEEPEPVTEVALGPLDLSPAPEATLDGEPYALPFFGELVEGAEHVPRPADADHVVEPIPPADEIICPRHVGPRPFPRRRRGERSVARRFPRHPARVSGGGVCPAAQQHDRARDAGDA